jgi:hypothetical protein
MHKIADRLNRSRVLGRLIAFVSVRLAQHRGVPILLGIILVVLSWLLHIIAALTSSATWQFIAFTTLHLAIFVGLLGVLLAEPLGKG